MKDANYLKWKRKNVTLRGSNNIDYTSSNGGMAVFGSGLYTAFLGNKELARKYGTVFFVLGAIPKHPKIVNTWNQAELHIQNMIFNYGKKHGIDNYFDSKKYFDKTTTIEDEMIANGYDGLVIKGREMVNYTPGDVKYFRTEYALKDYYETIIVKETYNMNKLRKIIQEEYKKILKESPVPKENKYIVDDEIMKFVQRLQNDTFVLHMDAKEKGKFFKTSWERIFKEVQYINKLLNKQDKQSE